MSGDGAGDNQNELGNGDAQQEGVQRAIALPSGSGLSRDLSDPCKLLECSEAGPCVCILRICGACKKHSDAAHPFALLRARRERPSAAAPPSSVMNSRRS